MTDKYRTFRDLGMLGSIGIMFVVSTFMGVAIAVFMDRKLGTSPWLTLIFLGFGITAAFISLYREIKRLIGKEDKNGFTDYPQ